MDCRDKKPLYRLYGVAVPHPTTLNATAILSVFPPPYVGRGAARVQRMHLMNVAGLGRNRIDEWVPSIATDTVQKRKSYVRGQFDDAPTTASGRSLRAENGQTSEKQFQSELKVDSQLQTMSLSAADMLTQDPGEDDIDDESD
ncbi:hypothetical protein BIW11_00159 [Tropilaelaps mercedesae]|uniref:Uncharacterized protein n=1 Tax=Tropilaelaps mercedesae TaxID=418985 RepID=A0A1V9Y0Y6_9ACAR|nr:hypothetical protein BIW11_00159 [Tropilaelaps mercedesae]